MGCIPSGPRAHPSDVQAAGRQPAPNRPGLTRVALDRVTQTSPFLRAEVHEMVEIQPDLESVETDALVRNIRANLQQIVQLSPVLSEDVSAIVANMTEPGRLTDFVASNLSTVSTAVNRTCSRPSTSRRAWKR